MATPASTLSGGESRELGLVVRTPAGETPGSESWHYTLDSRLGLVVVSPGAAGFRVMMVSAGGDEHLLVSPRC